MCLFYSLFREFLTFNLLFAGLLLSKTGLTQAPLKKGGWGDRECLEHYISRDCCVSSIRNINPINC